MKISKRLFINKNIINVLFIIKKLFYIFDFVKSNIWLLGLFITNPFKIPLLLLCYSATRW